MSEVIAKRVADFEHAKEPGDFFITGKEEVRRIQFLCPCGCGSLGGINISRTDPNAWTWDGNEDKPTISPSVAFLDGCRWHGWLINGIFTTTAPS
jgi:hypothetical protein